MTQKQEKQHQQRVAHGWRHWRVTGGPLMPDGKHRFEAMIIGENEQHARQRFETEFFDGAKAETCEEI